MPVGTARKVHALRRDFKTGAAVADLLGVNRSQVTRWLKGAGIDPLNAERIDLLELIWANLLRLYEPEAARSWLFGLNPHLGDRRPIDLVRRGLPLALARLELDDAAELVDLDEPRILAAHALRPSAVATRRRHVTQPQALALHRQGADGIRWWSTFESLWVNVTLFDHAA